MRREDLAPRHHVTRLAKDLMKYHKTDLFHGCETMGDLTATHITHMLGL
jgi:hypothetical protein